MLTTEDLI